MRRFNRLLHETRRRTGLTATGIADAAGVSKQQVHRWLNAENRPSHHAALTLGQALETHYPQANVTAAALLEAAGYASAAPTAASPATKEVTRVEALQLDLEDRQMLRQLVAASDPHLAKMGRRLLRLAEHTRPGSRRRARAFAVVRSEMRFHAERIDHATGLIDVLDEDDADSDCADAG